MLPPQIETFHNVKCGEIFCITAALFNVTCSLCGSTIHLDQFVGHFQEQHFTLAEQTINIEVVDRKCRVNLENDLGSVDSNIVKETDPGIDPIKEEQEFQSLDDEIYLLNEQSPSADDIVSDDDICLQERYLAAKALQKKKCLNREPKKKLSRRMLKRSLALDERDLNIKETIAEEKQDVKNELVNTINTVSKSSDASDKDMQTISDMQWSSEEDHAEDNIGKAEEPKEVPPFLCHICNRSYRNKKCLGRHIYNVHNPKNMNKIVKKPQPEHKCEECGEVFPSARNLRGHKWKHTGIYCDVCGKQFSQVGNMITHKIRHTGVKEHKCKECTKDFFTTKELKMHMLCHLKVMPVICEICGKGCRDRGVLTAHMRRHTGERPAKCDVCGKRFFSIHDLNVHAVAHTDARPFKCDICGSTFQRKKALRIHKHIHSDNRKHLCKICGKGFALSSGLNSHLRTHGSAWNQSMRKCEISAIKNNPAVSNANSAAEDIPQIKENLNLCEDLQQQIVGEFMILAQNAQSVS